MFGCMGTNLVPARVLESNPVHTFRKITLPLIMPGVISGALFAFVTSFDEVIVVLFLAGLENTTIPIQMWVGLREQLSPTILAVATCLIVMSTLILVSAELLRRHKSWVFPFGNFRIKAFIQLPETYRSITRPSSTFSAKASIKCS